MGLTDRRQLVGKLSIFSACSFSQMAYDHGCPLIKSALAMEFASVKTKEIRDFLRATEMLLSLLRRAEEGQLPKHELLMIQTYIASLKAHLLEVENSELVQRTKSSISAS
jgi:hypothetical protein